MRLLVVLLAALLGAGPALAAAPLHASTPTLSGPVGPASPAGKVLGFLGLGVVAGMAIKIRDTASLAQKYRTRAGAAQGDYKSGVEGAGADWEAGAKAGEGNYEAGVQEAIGKKRYGRGVSAAGASKYVKNAVDLGVARYPTGVAQGTDAWQRNVQPSLDKLKSLQLPPKGPKGSPQNQQRAAMVALELRKLKDAS
jgi:hypothetical protein